MQRFYFDITDDGEEVRDPDGLDFPDLRAAREQALRALAGIAADELPDGDRRDFVIEIREGDGPRLRATLSLRVENLS